MGINWSVLSVDSRPASSRESMVIKTNPEKPGVAVWAYHNGQAAPAVDG